MEIAHQLCVIFLTHPLGQGQISSTLATSHFVFFPHVEVMVHGYGYGSSV